MKFKDIDSRIVGTLVCMLFLAAVFIHTSTAEQKARFEKEKKERMEAVLYSPINDLGLMAHAAYMYDIKQNRVMYVKHEDWKLPLASLTKIMTTVVAKEVLPTDATITISPADISQAGDTGLKSGEKWPLENLLQLMLVASSNDAAHAIAVAVEEKLTTNSTEKISPELSLFLQKMNEKATTLGLTQTSFENETGLDLPSNNAGAFGSARDVAALLKYAYDTYPDLFAPTIDAKVTIGSAAGINHIVENTDTITNSVSSLLASKTGYTKIAGGNLAIIFEVRKDEPVIAIVLGSTIEGRFGDMQKMVAAAHSWRDRIDTALASAEMLPSNPSL